MKEGIGQSGRKNPGNRAGFRRLGFAVRTLSLLVAAWLSSAPMGLADELDQPPAGLLEAEHALSMDFETPHTAWASPYAGDPIRVLSFAPWFQGSTEGREIIELMQRFDIEAEAIYFLPGPGRLLGDDNPRWYGHPKAGSERALRLLKTPFDVVLVNKLGLDRFPKAVQSALKKRVADGAGLVILDELEAAPYSAAAVEAGDWPVEGRLFRHGQGRIAILPPTHQRPYEVGWETALEYDMARRGAALIWAAGKEPHLRLEAVLHPVVRQAELSSTTVTVKWASAQAGLEVRARLRRWDGEIFPLGTASSAAGLHVFPLPWLRTGAYHVEAFAASSEGVEAWAFKAFSVEGDRAIASVETDRDWTEVDETIQGTVQTIGAIRPGDALRAQLLDRRGRILARQDLGPAQTEPMPFSFKVLPWMPMLLRVEAVLADGPREVAAAHRAVRVTKRHQGQYNFVMWNVPTGPLAPYGIESLAHYGATAILQGGEPPLAFSASNLAFVPYAASFRKSSHTITAMLDEQGIMKGGCLYDEAVMAKWVQSVVEGCRAAREHGVFVYSLGDENAVRASCLSPHCLTAYRSYLSEVYGNDIAELNASWGTDYSSYDAITLLEGALPAPDAPKWFKEYFAQRLQKNRTDNEGGGEEQIVHGDRNDELRALQDENYARWYDRQAFQCHTYLQWCKRFAQAFRALDPQALTGFEGTDSFTIRRLTTRSRQGGDLDAFVRELDYFGPYGGPANEVVRSIAPPSFPMGNWIGYSMEADILLGEFWGQITNGMNTVQWWRWDNLDGYHGYLMPTLAPFPAVQELLDDTRIVREGLGSLLMQCHMHDDGIALYYSMPSTHIAHFDGNRTYGNHKRDHAIWHDLIHQAGLQFRYVTDRMMRQGEFDPEAYRVLILPLAFAIGPEEASAIRRFVKKGGTVIADIRPGLYDDHCKPLGTGILDDLFGVERTGKQDAESLDRLSVEGEIQEQPIAMRWGNWHGREVYPQMVADPTVTVTSGTELGKAYPIHFWSGLNHPVCIVNEYGKGRAILLNFSVSNAPAAPLVKSLLAGAGVAAAIHLESADGSDISGIEITRWQNGGMELLALLGSVEGEITVNLPEARFIHDLKQGRSLGKASSFSTLVRPHQASFFALWPEVPGSLELHPTSASVARGATLDVAVRMPGAIAKRAVRLTVATPDGCPAPWLDQVLIVDSGKQRFGVPIAHNDPLGEWRLLAYDLFEEAPAPLVFQVTEAGS